MLNRDELTDEHQRATSHIHSIIPCLRGANPTARNFGGF